MNSISVIVPVYNREKLVGRTLESILNQTLPPMELIVVDNASADSSYRVVENWMRANEGKGTSFKLLSETKPGAYAAREKGLENAEGEYVLFFDSDDEMHPDLIEKAWKTAKENKWPDLVCWECRMHLLNGKTRVSPFNVEEPMECHLIHSLLRTMGYIVKRVFLEKAGGWRKPLRVWDDYELGFRLLLRKPILVALPEILVEVYSQEESITGKDFSSKQGEWEKCLEEMEKELERNASSSSESVRKMLRYRRVILASHYFKEGNKKKATFLLNQTLEGRGLREKLSLRFAYHYTGKGFRGAWRILKNFY